MREQSPEQVAKKIERKMWFHKAFPVLLFEIAISAVVSDPKVAREAFEEVHKFDALPHD